MPSSIRDKAELRCQLRDRAAALTETRRRESDQALAGVFLALPQVETAGTLLLFRGVGTEPDTLPLFEALWARGKKLLLPRCLPRWGMEARQVEPPDRLVPGPYGIPEPPVDCPLEERDGIDLILVPGLAYDRAGNRLGQGGGYYDRYLADCRGITVALCRDALLLDRVPVEPHDRPVDVVLTETGRYGR